MQYIVRIRKVYNVFVQALSDMLIFDNEEKLARCQELLHRHRITFETFEVGNDAVNPSLNLVHKCIIAMNGEIMVQPFRLSLDIPPAEMFEENGQCSAVGYGLTPEEAIASAREAMKKESINAQSTK